MDSTSEKACLSIYRAMTMEQATLAGREILDAWIVGKRINENTTVSPTSLRITASVDNYVNEFERTLRFSPIDTQRKPLDVQITADTVFEVTMDRLTGIMPGSTVKFRIINS